MKKVVLLGDSIRMLGYGEPVKALLDGEFEVVWPQDNCRYAQYTLRGLYDWKDLFSGADIIHFNCGSWDMCDLFGDGPFTPLHAYCETMLRIARILKSYAPKVIFATTVPTHPDMWGHSRDRIMEYNAAVTKLLTEEGVMINDLFWLVDADIDGCICPDLIHLSDKGARICAEQTAKAIKEA